MMMTMSNKIYSLKEKEMSRKFVVGHIDWFDHELILELIEAENEMEAVKKHSKVGEMDWSIQDKVEDDDGKHKYAERRSCLSLSEMQQVAFDCDCMVNAIEVKVTEGEG